MKTTFTLLCGLLFSLSVSAYEKHSYNYVEGSYWDQSSNDVEGDGHSILGSFEISKSAFVTLGYSDGSVDEILGIDLSSFDAEIDYEGITIGFGGYGQVNERLSTWGGLTYTRETYEGRISGFSEDVDANSFQFGGGLRYWAFSQVEINGTLLYRYTESDDVDASDNDYGLGLGARFYLGDISLGVTAVRLLDAELDQLSASIRYNF